MTNRSMMEIHLDTLALVAGVIPPAHLTVSHAPAIKRPPRRHLRKGLCRALTTLASVLTRAAAALDAPHANAYHATNGQSVGEQSHCTRMNFAGMCSTPT